MDYMVSELKIAMFDAVRDLKSKYKIKKYIEAYDKLIRKLEENDEIKDFVDSIEVQCPEDIEIDSLIQELNELEHEVNSIKSEGMSEDD